MSGSWRARAEAYEPLKSADLGAALRELGAVIDRLAGHTPAVPANEVDGLRTDVADLRADVADLRVQLAALKEPVPVKATKAARAKATEGDAST